MKKVIFVGVMVVLVTGASQALIMDFVTVGNAGNANDDFGNGGVSYEYQIGKYEVTAGQYCEFLNAVAATDTYGLYNISMWNVSEGCKIQQSGSSGSYTYSVASDYADRPVNFVGWYDTLRFCNWLHNGQGSGDTEDGAYDMSLEPFVVRKSGAQVWLPNQDEWHKAAYHKNDGVTGNYFLYPTSSDTLPGRDMTEATNPGNNANYYDNGYLIGSPYYRTEVGEFELSDSPYGTFDMGGNVFEWNESPSPAPPTAIWRCFLGSSYKVQGPFPGSHMIKSIHSHTPAGIHHNGIGFRVASVHVPTNHPPVANASQDQIGYACIDGTAEVTLDGSDSNDIDGDQLSYYWSWMIGDEIYDANGVSPTIELPVGKHVIELIVDDGIDESEPNEVFITVIGPVEADVHILPRVINRVGRGRRVIVWLRLPEDITKDQVDKNQKLMLLPCGIEAESQYVIERRRWGRRCTSIIGFFDKAELMDAVSDNGKVELTVTGRLTSGQCIYGQDSVRIVEPKARRPRRRWRRWRH